MKKTTIISLFLFAILLNGLTFAGGKDGRRSDNTQRRIIPIESFDHQTNVTPVPFLTSLAESFEGTTFPPTGWTRYKMTGSTDPGWTRVPISTPGPLPGWNGGFYTAPPGGGTAVAFVTYNLSVGSNDEWLVTPQIMNVQPGDSLYFWLQKNGYTNAYLDNMDIKISTTTNAQGSFTVTVANLVFPANTTDTNWTRRGYNIGSLVSPGANIYIAFREHVVDNLNDGAAFSLDLVQVTGNPVGINNNGNEIPKSYNLEQNYPNPFNPTTNIKFALPKSGNVKLAVYDILGNEVSVLIDGYKQAGNYTADFDASKLSSGVYFYKLVSADFVSTKKMMLIK